MKLLTVPNWCFGRDKALIRRCREVLDEQGVAVHYCAGDVDHNRTVTAFSGDEAQVFAGLRALCDLLIERIDLNRHVGVHPRIGALDVCPFVILDAEGQASPVPVANELVQLFAEGFAMKYQIPVFLYEKSELGRHASDLPSLRKGGFGALLERELHPDFGPKRAHPLHGVSVVGVRDFLIAMNVNLKTENATFVKQLATTIRYLRREGDPRFLGVRALGFPLASRGETQISLNLTLPDITTADPIIEYVVEQAGKKGIQLAGTELIGVIRDTDVPHATRLPIDSAQIVHVVHPARQ